MIHKITTNAGRESLLAFGLLIPISCNIRNLENGLRKMDQVVWSENEDGSTGVPYSPQLFPQGIWGVGVPHLVDPKKDPSGYQQPYFIPTDAHCLVDVWTAVDGDGWSYKEKTSEKVMDWGYGLHFSLSRTTLGCLKVENKDKLLWLCEEIRKVMKAGDRVILEVG